jgi:hypothetical protein
LPIIWNHGENWRQGFAESRYQNQSGRAAHSLRPYCRRTRSGFEVEDDVMAAYHRGYERDLKRSITVIEAMLQAAEAEVA